MAVIIKIYRTKVFVVLCSIFMLVFLTPTSAHATGMPQLDFRNPLVNGQVIWGCVIFLVFYFALSRAMLPRVGRVLEDRSKRIRDDLDIARKAKRDTDKAIAELQQARKDALIEAKEHLQSALEEERLATEKRIREVHDRLKAEIDEAERDISAEKERALGSVRGIAYETTQLLVKRLVGVTPDNQHLQEQVENACSRHLI